MIRCSISPHHTSGFSKPGLTSRQNTWLATQAMSRKAARSWRLKAGEEGCSLLAVVRACILHCMSHVKVLSPKLPSPAAWECKWRVAEVKRAAFHSVIVNGGENAIHKANRLLPNVLVLDHNILFCCQVGMRFDVPHSSHYRYR